MSFAKRKIAKTLAQEIAARSGEGRGEKTVKIGESLRAGWSALGHNLWLMLGLAIAYGAAMGVGGMLSGVLKLAATLIQWGLFGVMLIACLHVIRHGGAKAGGVGDLPLEGPRMLNFLLVTLVITLIFIGGLILLVVPGFVWAIKYGFASAYALDEGTDLGESLRRSAALTNGIKWDLFLQGLAFVGVMILGLMALLVGAIPAAMCVLLAWTWTYVDLRKQAGEA
jgi:hypothetical protein